MHPLSFLVRCGPVVALQMSEWSSSSCDFMLHCSCIAYVQSVNIIRGMQMHTKHICSWQHTVAPF